MPTMMQLDDSSLDYSEGHGEHEHSLESGEEDTHDHKETEREVNGAREDYNDEMDLEEEEANANEDMEDEEKASGGPLLQDDFNATCRLAARLGAAAMKSGSIAENIERYLPKLMEVYGFYGFFSCSTMEISCNFEREDPHGPPGETIVRTQNVAIEVGDFQLTKLGMLSDLAKDLLEKKIGIQEANQLLDEILATPNPWGPLPIALSFVITGAMLPSVLSGTWWDMLLGPVAGAIAIGLLILFDASPARLHIWMNLTTAFLCSALGFAVQLLITPKVDPTIVTLSGIIILLPSCTITLGINDLVSGHVISGFERLVKGMITMVWLALGYILGMVFVTAIVQPDDDLLEGILKAKQVSEPIPALWQLLFIPIVCSAIAIVFQMTGKDMMGAILCMVFGYVTSYVGVLVSDNPYISSFMGSVAISTYANVWSRYYDRPNTIILFPSFQLVVAGIVGFMGLTEIVEGSDTEEGGRQVAHMLTVAGVVVIGFLVGGTAVQPFTTI